MCPELSRITFCNLHYDTRRCVLQSTDSKRLRLSPTPTHTPANRSDSEFRWVPVTRQGRTVPTCCPLSPSVLSPALSVPFGEGEFVKRPEVLSHLFWEETLGCLSASAGKREQSWPPPLTGVHSEADVPFLHLWDWSAGPEGTHSGGLGQGREQLQIKFPETDLGEPTALSPT